MFVCFLPFLLTSPSPTFSSVLHFIALGGAQWYLKWLSLSPESPGPNNSHPFNTSFFNLWTVYLSLNLYFPLIHILKHPDWISWLDFHWVRIVESFSAASSIISAISLKIHNRRMSIDCPSLHLFSDHIYLFTHVKLYQMRPLPAFSINTFLQAIWVSNLSNSCVEYES